MPKMHWCTGKVNLSGQNFTIVVFDALTPISWPEAQVLMLLHGSDNVYELKPCAISETSLVDEKNRLAVKYGFKPVEQVFPGRNPRMELLMPGEPEDQRRVNAEGKTNGDGEEDDDEPVDEPRPPSGSEEPPPKPTPPPGPEEPPPEPPPPAAVFKPGKQQPHRGV